MVGVLHDDRIRDARLQVGSSIPMDEAVGNPIFRDNGWDIYGDPYPIDMDHPSGVGTLRQAAAAAIRAQIAES
jgi:hypothetical protein